MTPTARNRPPRPTLPAIASSALLALALGACASSPGAGPAAPAAPATDGPIPLAWSWTEGDVTRYRMTSDTESTVSGNRLPEPMTSHVRQRIEMTQEVDGVSEDGVATVLVTYDRLEITTEAPGQEEVRWSSDDPESGDDTGMAQLAGAVGQLVGRTFTLRVDTRGEIVAVEGVDEILGDVAESLAAEEDAAVVRETMEAFLSEDNLKATVGQALPSFPARPVAPGDSWTEQTHLALPIFGALDQRQTYTFERLEGDEAVLSLDAEIRLGPDEQAAETVGLPEQIAALMDIEAETRRGDTEGMIRFDVGRGLLVRQDLTVRMDMTMTMTPKGDLAAQMDEPTVMDVSTTARTVYELIGDP